MTSSRSSRWLFWSAIIALAAYFFFFLIYPTFHVLIGSVFQNGRFHLGFYRDVFLSVYHRQCLVNSLLIGLLVTLFTTLVALPLALAAVKRDFRGKIWVHALVLLPMVMPPFMGALGLKQMLGVNGSVNILLARLLPLLSDPLVRLGILHAHWSPPAVDWLQLAPFWGVVFLEVLHLYPIMYLNVVACLANVDPSLEEAAANLGGSRFNVFRRVTFPLMLPGFFAGASIVFIWAFTDLGAPLVLQFDRVIPNVIYDMRTQANVNPQGYVVVVMTLLLTAVLYLLARRFMSRRTFSMMTKGTVQSAPPRASRKLTLLIYAFLAGLTCFALMPHFAVLLASFSARWQSTVLPSQYTLNNFVEVFSRSYTLSAILHSLLYSACCTLLVLVLGVVIAYLLVRTPFRGASILDAFTMLPLALPGLVLAFGYLTCYYDVPLLGVHANPFILIVVAYSMRRLPYMVRAAVAGFQQVSTGLEEASVNLGASRLRTLARITLPLVAGNLLAGALLTFTFSMFEVSCSLMLLQTPDVFSFSPALYKLLNDLSTLPAAALAVSGMAVLSIGLFIASRFLGKRMGELFRI